MPSEVLVTSLVGVYDADGTALGELSYWFGARIGRAHCALCEVTHGLFLERAEWRSWRASLPVEFELFHRDDMPQELASVLGEPPGVIALTAGAPVLLLDREDLDRCAGSVEGFAAALDVALRECGLRLPG